MSKSIRTVLTAIAATVSLACLAAPAMADTPWQANHPRREQVNNARIHQEVREGEMSHGQAARLHRADHRIRLQERRMAARHGGHLTKHEQRRLNREENHVSHRIGK